MNRHLKKFSNREKNHLISQRNNFSFFGRLKPERKCLKISHLIYETTAQSHGRGGMEDQQSAHIGNGKCITKVKNTTGSNGKFDVRISILGFTEQNRLT